MSGRKAVAYLRVSTKEQHLGPEAQRAAIEKWAASEGVIIVEWCLDKGISGAAPIEKRPGLVRAIAAIKELKADLLVAAKRDRIARDPLIADSLYALLRRQGATMLSAAEPHLDLESPMGQAMAGVADVFARLERRMIGVRIKEALAVKKSRGERVGTVPYGFVADASGRLMENDQEQGTLSRIRALRGEGESIRRIVRTLEVEGHLGRTGRPLGVTQVARVLRSANAKPLGQSSPTHVAPART